ncbi:MAG: GNAT family N-acetyltransferase [Caldilineaceae bacterium]|nr:GNAT family N-acetyltransferase [Caldilineaceae bacterium]
MTLTRCSMLEWGFAETVESLNQGFTGYQVPLSFTLSSLLQAVRVDGIDATASQIVRRAGQAVGVALIARRGWRCRLAAMAIAPAARGQGVGRWLMREVLSDARKRGERGMVLEVIETNTPAVKLYQSGGFQTVRRLVSYERPAAAEQDLSPEATRRAALQEVDIHTVAQLVTAHGLPDLPWQLSGPTVTQLGPPYRAYQLEDAYALISDPAAAKIGIRALLVLPESRGQGQGVRLLQALAATFPEKALQVPALFPEEMGSTFVKAGFTRDALAQLQMATQIA